MFDDELFLKPHHRIIKNSEICFFSIYIQAHRQTFEKGGANFKNFTKEGANLKKTPISRSKLGV